MDGNQNEVVDLVERGPGGRWTKGCRSPNPAGRPVSPLTQLTRRQAEIANLAEALPLEIMLAIARRDPVALRRFGIDVEDVDFKTQLFALQTCLPFTARRLPVAVCPEDTPPLLPVDTLQTMSDENLKSLHALLQDLGLTDPDLLEGPGGDDAHDAGGEGGDE